MNIQHNRRTTLRMMSSRLGGLAFAAMAVNQARGNEPENPLAIKQPHFAPKAKHIIFLSMRGAPSHVDTFDYKPQLTRDSGKAGKYGSGIRGGVLLGSPWKFRQRGDSGLWISDLFPNISRHADELCLLRGMHCDQPNHAQATTQTHTGNFQFVRPSLGAWSLYGLGTENANLPGFIILNPSGGAINFGSAFLPAVYQGTKLGSSTARGARRPTSDPGAPKIPNIQNPRLNSQAQRVQLDFVQQLNRAKLKTEQHQPQVEGIIQSFELAFRMQTTMPELVDLLKEI